MRKIKKINGFLVVKFNDREKREYYHPPVKAIREAAERIREGRMEYAAEALTRRSDPEEPRRP